MKIIRYVVAGILTAFGLLTLFLSTSVIIDLFGIREKEGNYVLFVVWANFVASFMYLVAAYGFFKAHKWTTTLLTISSLVLIIAFIGLKYHIASGGIYEEKTVRAMIFRISVTAIFTLFAYFLIPKTKPMITRSITILALSALLFGCANSKTETATENQSAPPTVATNETEEHHHDDEQQAIELNNGQKWKVDENMMKYIRSMETDVNSFTGETLADFKSLSEKLKKNTELLTSNCTMEGKAHDELHKWLLPYIDMSEKFAASSSEQEAGDYYSVVKNSFIEFNKYFE